MPSAPAPTRTASAVHSRSALWRQSVREHAPTWATAPSMPPLIFNLRTRCRVISQGNLGIVVDGAGSAYLVADVDPRLPEGGFRITCRAGVPGLGVLRLDGRCGDAVCPIARPEINHLLQHHLDAVDPAEVTVVEVDLEAVTVLAPATDLCRACAIPVALDAYASARSESWLLDVAGIVECIEREHQFDLRILVGALGYPNAPAAIISVTSMSSLRLDLVCMDADGVTAVTVPFGTRLDHPAEVPGWLAQAAGRPFS